jgi:hypothetical protein
MDALQKRTSSRLTADTPSSARPVTTHTWPPNCNGRCDSSLQTDSTRTVPPTVSLASPAGEQRRSPPCCSQLCTLGVVGHTHTQHTPAHCKGGVRYTLPVHSMNNTPHDGVSAAVTWSTRYVDTLGRERPHRSVPRGVRMELVGEAWCSAFTAGACVVMYTVGGSLVDAACGPAVARGEKP